MIYSYKEALEAYGSRYQIKKAIEDAKLFKVERGYYSDEEDVSSLKLITAKYPNAIFTSKSAYYFYDLTDVIPRKNYLAIEKHQKIKINSAVELSYMVENLHELGITTLKTHNTIINIYNREKLLIELVRNKNNFGYDYYKEIIKSYRDISSELDIQKIMDYLKLYKNKEKLQMIIQDEVF